MSQYYSFEYTWLRGIPVYFIVLFFFCVFFHANTNASSNIFYYTYKIPCVQSPTHLPKCIQLPSPHHYFYT